MNEAPMLDLRLDYVKITGSAVDALETRKESDRGPTEEQVNRELRAFLSRSTARGSGMHELTKQAVLMSSGMAVLCFGIVVWMLIVTYFDLTRHASAGWLAIFIIAVCVAACFRVGLYVERKLWP